MRILIWAMPFWPVTGGRELFTARLARGLVARGHDVLVLAPETDIAEFDDPSPVEGLDIERLPLGPLVDARLLDAGSSRADIPRARERVRGLVSQFRPDLIHAQALAPDLLLVGDAARAAGVPVVVTDHVLAALPATARLRLIHGAARIPEIVVAPSASAAATVSRLVPSVGDRVRVVRCGVPVPANVPSVLPDVRSVLYVGRLVPEKGVAVALTAWSIVARSRPELTLTIAGDGPDRSVLELLAAHLVVGDRVRFVGWRSSDEVADLLENSGVVLVPSLWSEPFGLVAAEAAAQGRPVIASRVGGLPEVVIDQQTGLLVEPGDILGLVGTLNGLLADPGRVHDLGAAARHHAVAHLGFDACVDRYETVYRELAAS